MSRTLMNFKIQCFSEMLVCLVKLENVFGDKSVFFRGDICDNLYLPVFGRLYSERVLPCNCDTYIIESFVQQMSRIYGQTLTDTRIDIESETTLQIV